MELEEEQDKRKMFSHLSPFPCSTESFLSLMVRERCEEGLTVNWIASTAWRVVQLCSAVDFTSWVMQE